MFFFLLGNRWLRGQKPHESKSLDDVVYPRRSEKDSWHFFKILECCNHFLGQGGGGAGVGGGVDATSTRPMAVTLITANGQEESDLMQVPKSKGNNNIQKMEKKSRQITCGNISIEAIFCNVSHT